MKLLSTLVFAILLAGCDAKKTDHAPTLHMNTASKTHCIGHYRMDLPADYGLPTGASARLTPDQDAVESAKIDLRARPVADAAAFTAQVSERHADLASSGDADTNKLVSAKQVDGGGTLFRVLEIGDAYQSELHWMWRDKYLSATIHSYKNQAESAEALLLALMKNVGDAPPSGGASAAFCFDDLAIAGRYRAEAATLRFKSAKTPDIAFAVDVDTYRPDDATSLLQRVGGPQSLLRKFDAKEAVLRKGELQVSTMKAQEWGASIQLGENGDEKQLTYVLETMRPVPSPTSPQIHLEMTVKGSAAHDEKGASALWDKVTRTIRPG